MRALITPHVFSGTVQVPASKSHTIRRLIMAALTKGSSRIEEALDALDIRSCAAACRVLGADLAEDRDSAGRLRGWIVQGRSGAGRADLVPADRVRAGNAPASGAPPDAPPALCIDAGNSGTTLFFALAAAALASVPVTFTGDGQIARRSAGPLLDALAGLGVSVSSNRGPGGDRGYTPITVRGPWKGGRVSMPCPTSQYLSALLIAAPLAPAGTVTEIRIPLLNEKPYVDMTLDYLKTQGLSAGSPSAGPENPADEATGPAAFDAAAGDAALVMAADYSYFRISGGRFYTPMNGLVPGDFSSAAFPAAAAVISGGTVTLRGLDPADTQGDKAFFEYLARMGCNVQWEKTGDGCSGDAMNSPRSVTVSRRGPLRGGVFDLNAVPDLLPVMAALAAYAEGETALINAAHARIKETDRIAVMAGELGKLGVSCQERPDGLVIRGKSGGISGPGAPGNAVVRLDGRGDHRVVMALACAALGRSPGSTAGFTGGVEIDGAEAADVSYPGFLELLGAR
ncbi:MAG: 3-phosphoshikimate 1-carboxyvinyltransferase [Treponema sp.]|jgi:3-phosphoshikimate 1-carboxyvinyltransferase|nr:3-phosphoshikimate 1-carboxyvinyltransferase [Treponema sp.]